MPADQICEAPNLKKTNKIFEPTKMADVKQTRSKKMATNL
jgi:hypothetical protein